MAALEHAAVQLAANLVRQRLQVVDNDQPWKPPPLQLPPPPPQPPQAPLQPTIFSNGSNNRNEQEDDRENAAAAAANEIDHYEDEFLLANPTVPAAANHSNNLLPPWAGPRLVVPDVVKGRFRDLTGDLDGETALEQLFLHVPSYDATTGSERVLLLATVMIFQSLCIMGAQVGLKGLPEQLKRSVAHLEDANAVTATTTTTASANGRGAGSHSVSSLLERDLQVWDCDSIRRLKYRLDRTPALQLLAELHLRRTPLGAFNLLVALGVWKKHEDLALLRSGFPLRFTNDELQAARQAQLDSHAVPSRIRDPDQWLGLRRDMTNMKVYTIDSASTSEVDDGISLEVVERKDGTKRNRIWVHIADVSRWASHRDSPLFQIARKRITSLYLPHRSISMFPPSVSTELMSLKANTQRYALSLAVEINDDGSVDPSSVTITPSLIRPSYRLTYDEVDDMLEEGIGYKEEWELGALLDAATLRRNYRIRQGSTEGIIPNPVPYSTISVYHDRNAPDGLGIAHNIQVSHNAGKNVTALAEETEGGASNAEDAAASTPSPVSSAYLLVTEMMILAGEAIGQFKSRIDEERMQMINGQVGPFANQLRLAFRTQLPPGKLFITALAR